MEERCDQITNCKDKSDENNCKLIVFEENYNAKVPPFTITEENNALIPAKIRVSTQLKNVLAISEFSHTIDLKIGITLRWYENRVLYHNLKSIEALNVLTDSEVLISKSRSSTSRGKKVLSPIFYCEIFISSHRHLQKIC